MAKILVKNKLQHLAVQKKDTYITHSGNLPMIDENTHIQRSSV